MSDKDCAAPPKLTFAYSNDPNLVDGKYVPPDLCVGTLDYSTSDCSNKESAYVSNLMAQALQIAGGPVNVFPMLGVYNQGSTVDQVGAGYPLSSGTGAGSNVADAFNVNVDSWRSSQTGSDVTSKPAYIGYDFGTKKAWEAIGPAQERYQPGEPLRKKIATVKIQQGVEKANRAAQVVIEASDDGISWKRMDAASLPDTSALVTIAVRSSAPYRMWRIVPTFFNGVSSNSAWEVTQVQLLEETQISLDNIEDLVLLENRDRSYCRTSTMLKAQYDLLDVQTELAKFGINIPQTYIFTASFAMMVTLLGRPIVVGDILELPGEMQYDAQLRPVHKWLEVTDTSWSTEGYTMNWRPQLFRFYAQPILPSVEHKDILGLPGQVNAKQDPSDFLLSGLLQNQQAYDASDAIGQAAADLTPQDGQDSADIQSGTPLIGAPGNYDGNDLYAADAIPPNGATYTVGDELPDITSLEDGHYHRQTYTAVPASIRPPDRLLKLNKTKGRWFVVEINSRNKPESHKKTIARILSSMTQLPIDKKL